MKLRTLLAPGALVLVLTGCPSKAEFNALEAEVATLRAALDVHATRDTLWSDAAENALNALEPRICALENAVSGAACPPPDLVGPPAPPDWP